MAVKVVKGKGGFGGPLIFDAINGKNKVLCITGGGIHPVAAEIARLLNCEAVDGFKSGFNNDEIVCVVIDCGGTARCGVYPKNGIFTINVEPVGKSGPLQQYITEEIYVSDVDVSCISLVEAITKENIKEVVAAKKEEFKKDNTSSSVNIFIKIGKAVGSVVGTFYQAARDAIDTVLRSVLPFMAFISLIMGIIMGTGAGDFIANTISPFAGNIFGLLVISIICCLPFLSPVLGPGAVMAQVIGVLIGTQIGMGAISPLLALPALFAIDGQVGCDFTPVGLSLGEAKEETIEIGVPAILFSRLITGPIAVLVAYGIALIVGI